MIGRLVGCVVEQGLDGTCILDVQGVGYELFVPLGSVGKFATPPELTTLFVHTHIREDQFTLYGFRSLEDREGFRKVLGVTGIGPKIALALVSALPGDGLARAVSLQDPKAFKGIPGVGKKTVERLLLELKDKLHVTRKGGNRATMPAPPPQAMGPQDDMTIVYGALVQMGYKPPEAERAIAGLTDTEGKPVEELLRTALSSLG